MKVLSLGLSFWHWLSPWQGFKACGTILLSYRQAGHHYVAGFSFFPFVWLWKGLVGAGLSSTVCGTTVLQPRVFMDTLRSRHILLVSRYHSLGSSFADEYIWKLRKHHSLFKGVLCDFISKHPCVAFKL